MTTQIFVPVLCWLIIGVQGIKVNVTVKDSKSAASVLTPRSGISHKVYASGVPHGAFPIQRPIVVGPTKSASNLVPVKEEHLVVKNQNGYLKDSYGNSFAASPQMLAYKTILPRQFVKIQDLPLHLSKPLDAASAPVHILSSAASPQYSYGSSGRVPAPFQSASSGSSGYTSPFFSTGFYSGNLRSFSPQTSHFPRFSSGIYGFTPQQQSSNHKHVVYANNQPYSSQNIFYEGPKSQKYIEADQPQASNTKLVDNHHAPQTIHNEKAKLKKATQYGGGQKKYKVKIGNGDQVTVTLNTKPPIPNLLDLSLLEPLTFDNPIVPQVQHFLPKITYDLPEVEEERHHNEFIVKKTKSYDSGAPPQDDESEEAVEVSDDDDEENEYNNSEENDDPEPAPKTQVQRPAPKNPPTVIYEFNTPKHKETFSQQTVSYNNNKDSKPVTYSYNEKTNKKPVSYSYTHSSGTPNTNKQSYTNGVHHNNEAPIVYNYKSDSLPTIVYGTQKNSKLSDVLPHYQSSVQSNSYGFQPSTHELKAEHRNVDHHYSPSANLKQKPLPPTPHPSPKTAPILSNQQTNTEHQQVKIHYLPNGQLDNGQQKLTPFQLVQDKNGALRFTPVNLPPKAGSAAQVPLQPINEFEENIKVLPKPEPKNERIIVPYYPQPKAQHRGEAPSYSEEDEDDHGSSSPYPSQHHHSAPQKEQPSPQNQSSPNVIEKSRNVIIQEEAPEEMHLHREQMTAEVVDEGDSEENPNSEEDFEESYKNAAFGFPAFDREDNPFAPKDHGDFDYKNSPFEEYIEEGDTFPKSSRLRYQDDSEGTKEDYFLDYNVKKPESFMVKNKEKENYYKMYKSRKPEHEFSPVPDKKESFAEKYSSPPVFDHPEPRQKPTTFYAQYKAPPKFGFDYSMPKQRDSFPLASGAMFRAKTSFVEPQFQYGFEPIGLPNLLDSELAAMASNLHPKTDKSGTRKKIYKENFYIKKTTTSGAKPAS